MASECPTKSTERVELSGPPADALVSNVVGPLAYLSTTPTSPRAEPPYPLPLSPLPSPLLFSRPVATLLQTSSLGSPGGNDGFYVLLPLRACQD